MKLKGSRRTATYKYLYVADNDSMNTIEGAVEVKHKCKDVRRYVSEMLENKYGKGVVVELDVVRTDITFDIPYELIKEYIVKEK